MVVINKSISVQVCDIIRDKIIKQEYKAGTKIETRKLAEQYDISIMPVRDALKNLCSEGLVENRSTAGFFVRTFTKEEIEDIMELRCLLEEYCLREYFNELNKIKLFDLYNKMKKAEEIAGKEFYDLDNSLHEIIIRSSNNEYIIKSYNQLKNLINIFRYIDEERVKTANEEHLKLIKLILNDNKEAAIKQLKRHLNNLKYSIEKKF